MQGLECGGPIAHSWEQLGVSSTFARAEGKGKRAKLTRVAHGGMQEIHGRPGQAQPVHAVWGLFEVRHHANSRVETPRRIQEA